MTEPQTNQDEETPEGAPEAETGQAQDSSEPVKAKLPA